MKKYKDTQLNGAGLSSSSVSPNHRLKHPAFIGILKRAPTDRADVGRAMRTAEASRKITVCRDRTEVGEAGILNDGAKNPLTACQHKLIGAATGIRRIGSTEFSGGKGARKG